MIGSIRKHSAWLWWVIAALTIASFVWWGVSPGSRYGSGHGGGRGTIYGKQVTDEDFRAAQREFMVYYWMQTHQFPKLPNFTETDLDRETYVRLLLKAKARELGIHVNTEAQQAVAVAFLSSLTRDHQPVPMSQFVERVLQPEGLDASDFQRAIADDLAIEQLERALGMSGALIPPQDASAIYDRNYQEFSAQAVFFSASNYVSQVVATPAAVSEFYSNHIADLYRLPDRIQLNYIEYGLSNFLEAAQQKIGTTNLANQVESIYEQQGMKAVPDANTPEEAKAKIREAILHQTALPMAQDKARQFLTELFAMSPVAPENLVALAKTNGLTVRTTEPFSASEGPAEFPASADFVDEAFKKNSDYPFFIKPVVMGDAVYVVGLAKQIPSEIEPFGQVHDHVVADFKYSEAVIKARAAGTNFYYSAAVQMAAGKTFAQAALAAGQSPVALRPFSLAVPDVPEAEGHVDPRQLVNVAASTPVGHISRFEPAENGGFVLFVQSLLPVDEARKTAEMPRFMTQLRRNRESEAFNIWLGEEANRELKNTPVYEEMMRGRQAPGRS